MHFIPSKHHRFDGYEFEQAPGVSDGQGSLACCGPWGRMFLIQLVGLKSDTSD